MTDAPERIWAWCFQAAEHGGWENWGGYARKDNLHPLDRRENATGAEYVRADLYADLARVTAERDALREACNQARLAFAGLVSVQSAIDKIDALGGSGQ